MENSQPVSFSTLFNQQASFNKKIYGLSASQIANQTLLRDLCLSLFREVGDLSTFVNLNSLPHNNHHPNSSESSPHHKLLFESVDVIRYTLAILNLANISSEEFLDAWHSKDAYLNKKYVGESRTTKGTIICDVDDVISRFREDFHLFVHNRFGVELQDNSYYSTAALARFGHKPDEIFSIFIEEGGLRSLNYFEGVVNSLNKLYETYNITLLTARPSSNLKCQYDTYAWLEKIGLKYDRLDFSAEKYLWTTQQGFEEGEILLAIDDSAKNISDYCEHGIRVLAPSKSYNEHLNYPDKLFFYDEKSQEDFEKSLSHLLQDQSLLEET